MNPQLNKKVKKYLDSYFRDTKANSPEHQEAVMLVMRGALTDANFHSEAKELGKYFPKASKKYIGTPMEGVIEDKGVDIAKMAKWDGHDIIDAFAFYLSMSIGGSFGNRLMSLKESIQVNEKNEPNNKELWSRAIAAAKAKYDVYPSAYANAFASNWYKEKGGTWKTKSESVTEADVKKKINRKGNEDGLLVQHNGKEYHIVYSGDFGISSTVMPYGIVMPGDDTVSFLSKDRNAKTIWKQLKPKVDKFLKSNESVNEETINEIGVLGVASGVALGLVGVIALSKGVGFAKRQFGNAMSVVADKMEKKVKKIESDNAKKAIMDIAKKFENDKKLQGMYQSLPAYKDGGKNSERKKGMAEIAKYVKSKLSSDEMEYFYDLNTYLRTNKIKGTLVAPEKKSAFQKRLDKLGADNAHLSNESVNEDATRTAMEIGGLTGVNKDAIQKFVDDNKLDIEKLYQFVKKGKLADRMKLVSAIAGKPNNPVQKKMVKQFGEGIIKEAKVRLGKDSVNFKVIGDSKGLTLIAASGNDLDGLQDAIENDVDVKEELRKTLEKQLKVPVEVDRGYDGAGFRFNIDFYSLAKKVK